MDSLEQIAKLEDIKQSMLLRGKSLKGLTLNLNGVNVYLVSKFQERIEEKYSVKLGGSLASIDWMEQEGIWYIFKSRTGGKILAQDSKNKGCEIIRVKEGLTDNDSPVLSFPADNYGHYFRLLLKYE